MGLGLAGVWGADAVISFGSRLAADSVTAWQGAYIYIYIKKKKKSERSSSKKTTASYSVIDGVAQPKRVLAAVVTAPNGRGDQAGEVHSFGDYVVVGIGGGGVANSARLAKAALS